MKVLLLSGAKPVSSKFGGYSVGGPRLQPYNLLQMAAVLRSRGTREINLIDTEIEKPEISDVIDFIRTDTPDLIGISVYSKSLSYVYALLRRIRDRYPGIIIAAGGPHVTIDPEGLLRRRYIDYAVAGEADYAFSELVETLDAGRETGKIDNLCYLAPNGEIVRNPRRPYIQNLDELPYPDFELIRHQLPRYRPQIMTYQRRPMTILVTSRGCVYHCAFCPASGIWGPTWRGQSGNYVVNLIEWLNREFSIREICFNENTFSLDRKRVLDISRGLIERRLDITWSANVNLRHLDEELLWNMKKSGCWMLSVGIESGDDRILREVNKPVTVREIREKAGLLDRMGFKIRGFFMLGNLGDTEESMNRTIAFSRKLPLFSANFSVLIPIQGSEIYREIYGGVNHLDGTGEDDNYSVKNVSSFRHPRFTMAELDRFQRRAFREFFLNFRRFFLILDSVNTPEDIRKYTVLCLEILRNLLRLVWLKIKERLSRPWRTGQAPDRKSIIDRRTCPSRPPGD